MAAKTVELRTVEIISRPSFNSILTRKPHLGMLADQLNAKPGGAECRWVECSFNVAGNLDWLSGPRPV